MARPVISPHPIPLPEGEGTGAVRFVNLLGTVSQSESIPRVCQGMFTALKGGDWALIRGPGQAAQV
jgi:hypothetical protein